MVGRVTADRPQSLDLTQAPNDELMTTLVAIALAMLSPWASPQAHGERLYAQTANGLQVYDAATGEHLQSTYFPSLINNKGLVYDDGRLYTMNQNLLIWRDYMVEVHPATSRYSEIGGTGMSIGWADVSLLRDPTSDQYYVVAASEVYRADMDSGKLTYLSRIEQGVAIITALAIDSQGEVFCVSPPSVYYPKAAIYNLRLDSGKLTRVGDLDQTPILFTTLAFDREDRLWGAGFGPYTQQVYRLYRIDLETFEFHSTFPLSEGAPWAAAIAFGPAPEVATFCDGKTSPQGCTPKIAWKGLPSASAHFGFEVSCTEVVSESPGFLMLGLGGQADLPFQGGTLCVGEPILRTTPQTSGGSGACTGAWSLDVNAWLFQQHPMEPGDRFTCQWWGRDPGLSGRNSAQLSDALEVVLLP